MVRATTEQFDYNSADPVSLLVEANTRDGKATSLRQDSVNACINLATINEGLIAKKIGRLSPALTRKIDASLKAAPGLP